MLPLLSGFLNDFYELRILFTKAKRWEKMQKHEKQSQQVEQKITYN